MQEGSIVAPELRSWIPVPEGSDFPIQNLPYGVFRHQGGSPRAGVAIGDHVLNLASVAEAGLFKGHIELPEDVFTSGSLNLLLSLERPAWLALRQRISELLSEDNWEIRSKPDLVEQVLLPMEELELLLPVEVGDYVDFYSSLEHATNLGKMMRPGSEPLMPNWRYLPVGYHGRSSSIIVSGTNVKRPHGQLSPADAEAPPSREPTRMLDFELEVGFITGGSGNDLGEPIPVSEAREHVFGLVLVNDWSARDIQRWEYQPLGPFLSKSFATSISPWVVPLDALEPYRVAGPSQDPPTLRYLQTEEDWAFDVELEVWLSSEEMEKRSVPAEPISRTNFRSMYWNIAQQLAHATSGGANIRPGDVYASGTISGANPGTYGSMIELTWRGEHPLKLADGSERTFLRDGDAVVMRGFCSGNGRPHFGFGEVNGRILPAS